MARHDILGEYRPMEHCARGNHTTTDAFAYDGETWCPAHLPPPGDVDNVQPGTCEIGRAHYARDGVWWLPKHAKWACKRHLGILIREAVRRWEYGR